MEWNVQWIRLIANFALLLLNFALLLSSIGIRQIVPLTADLRYLLYTLPTLLMFAFNILFL